MPAHPTSSEVKRALARPREAAGLTDGQRQAMRTAFENLKIWWHAPLTASGEGARLNDVITSVERLLREWRQGG
jgi:hypothetical protein